VVNPADTSPPAPLTDHELEARFAAVKGRSAWRVLVRNTARSLFDRLRETEQRELNEAGKEEARLVRKSVGLALESASYRPPRWRDRVSDWASGSGIEGAWSALHNASQRLLMIQTTDEVKARLGEIDAALRSNLKADDPRLKPASDRLGALGEVSADELDHARSEIRQYLQTADSASDAAYANVRSFRNLLIFIGGFVSMALLAVAIVHALAPDFLDLSGPAPAKGMSRPDAVEVWETEVAGTIGGLVAALFTITRLGGFADAYRLPAYQALIRIPAGALIGLVAAILLQAQFIDVLKPQYGLSLLAYALVFGYAPEPLLRYIDQRAQKVLGQAQSKNDPGRPALAKPAQTSP
jgi:hypothetical protein